MSTQPLATLCYVSSAVAPLSADYLEALLRQSRDRNAANEVTGALLYCDGNFIQYLEGPTAGMAPIWASIRKDPRHSGVIVLFEDTTGERLFPMWSMAYNRSLPPDLERLLRLPRPSIDPGAHGALSQMSVRLLHNFWGTNLSCATR